MNAGLNALGQGNRANATIGRALQLVIRNVGGGRPYTVAEFADIVSKVYGKDIQPSLPGYYRYGDTRHICSDIGALQSLGWTPKRNARESVEEYVQYLRDQTDVEDILEYAEKKMKAMNVVRSIQ
jgi:dTDP-L-rhamnose 4-epimerase